MECPRRTSVVLVLSLALAAALAASLAPAPAAAQEEAAPAALPCGDDPRHRQLDFWLGEWRVVGEDERPLGTSRVTRRHGGCAVAEEWTSARPGVSGESLNYVDPSDGRWRQVWVGSGGFVIEYQAELRDGAMHFQGRAAAPDGTVRLSRMVLEPIAEGRVRQRIDGSEDGGVTWTRDFEGLYEPVGGGGAPAPAPPAPSAVPAPEVLPTPEAAPAPEADPSPRPVPAPAPPAAGEVVAFSIEVPDAEPAPPPEQPETHLRSPMVLELTVGPVEALPSGYSWSTTETARFVADGASIRRVTVARAERRGGFELTVGFVLHATGYLQHADLEVELVAGGDVVGSGRLADFAFGRGIPGQNTGEGLEKRLVLALDRETFERAFAGDERPTLRLTLRVRG